MNKGQEIDNSKGWLVSVLKRKHYDYLRRKYKKPTVSYDVIMELPSTTEELNQIEKLEEAEQIRASLAQLSKLYREVMVRHYMNGESIEQIAVALNISPNTVKSRLFIGRKQMRKEFEMESYVKQSYEPDTLWICSSGECGMQREPFSLVGDDRITMNLLILAYQKPITITGLAKAIGIVSAFIEPIIDKLVAGELMKRVGDKVYTDFIIFTEKDRTCNFEYQMKVANENYEGIWATIDEGLLELRQQYFYLRQNERQKKKLEAFFAVRTMLRGVTNLRDEVAGGTLSFKDYPQRPDGGKWLAMGDQYTATYDSGNNEYWKYELSGEAGVGFEDYQGFKFVYLGEYDTELGRTHLAYTSLQYIKYTMENTDVLKMLCAVYAQWFEDFDLIGGHCLEQIDHFIDLGYLVRNEERVEVDLPIFTQKERWKLYEISERWDRKISEKYKKILIPMMEQGAVTLPKHLKSVPEWQRYMWCCSSLPMMVLLRAREEGFF